MSHHNLFNGTMHENQPVVMFIISICSLTSSYLLPMMNNIYTLHIPPIIMESAQLLAWVITGCLGIIGIYNFLKKKLVK